MSTALCQEINAQSTNISEVPTWSKAIA